MQELSCLLTNSMTDITKTSAASMDSVQGHHKNAKSLPNAAKQAFLTSSNLAQSRIITNINAVRILYQTARSCIVVNYATVTLRTSRTAAKRSNQIAVSLMFNAHQMMQCTARKKTHWKGSVKQSS